MWNPEGPKASPHLRGRESFAIHIGHDTIIKLEWWSWFYWTFSLINTIISCIVVNYEYEKNRFTLFVIIFTIIWFAIGIYPSFCSYLLHNNYSAKLRNFMIFIIIISLIDFGLCFAFLYIACDKVYEVYLEADQNMTEMTSVVYILMYISILMSFCSDILLSRMIYLDIVILFEWKRAFTIHESNMNTLERMKLKNAEERSNVLQANDK
eukprot:402242_1